MRANALTWTEFVNGGPLDLNQLPTTYPLFEVHVAGNTVSGKQIAGLIFISQQSAHVGSGVVRRASITVKWPTTDPEGCAHFIRAVDQ